MTGASMSLRRRIFLASALPAVLISALTALVLIAGHFRDLDRALAERGRSLARQLATGAEFPLFAGNRDALRALAEGTCREEGVVAVSFFDGSGTRLAAAGRAESMPTEYRGAGGELPTGDADMLRLALPVAGELAVLDDPFAQSPAAGAAQAPQVLGHLLVDVSRAPLREQKRRLALYGVGALFGALALAWTLALAISRGVSRPVLRLADVVERIGQGELSARVVPDAAGSVRRLEAGVNEMAARLESARDHLQHRIDEATAEIRRKKDEAEAATLAQSRFLAAASHDLRQPMHALGLFVSRLARLEHAAETREVIAHVEDSVRAMQDLLEALLDISRLDAGVTRPHRRPVSLGPLMARLAEDHRAVAADKGLRLRVRETGLWVDSDPVLLERILLNLLANAIRHTVRGGVLIGVRRRGQAAVIEVWDTGPGIPEEYRREVFKEFFQLGHGERDRAKGLGLGLAIVERTARLLDHPVGLRSRVGRGSVFSLQAPLAAPGPEGDAAGAVAAEDMSAVDVAVVDDDPLVRQAMQTVLEGWGCRVFAGAGGDEVLAALGDAGAAPALLVTDCRLADGETGFDVGTRFREVFGGALPVALVTGDTDAELQRRAAETGWPLLRKPLQPARLRALLRRMTSSI